MRFSRLGIRAQLMLLVPGLVALGLVVAQVAIVRVAQRYEYDDFRQRNEKLLTAVGTTVAIQVAQNDLSGLDTLVFEVSRALAERGLAELAVLDEHGRVLAHSDTTRFNVVLSDDFTRTALDSEVPTWRRQDDQLWLAAPASSGIRWATVTARFSLARLEERFAQLQLAVVVVSLAVFLLLSLSLYLGMQWLALRPLEALTAAVRRMGQGDLAARSPQLQVKELAELSENVNRMAEALQAQQAGLEKAVQERTQALEEANRRLERLAVTDGLTGLYNHRRFQEQLHAEVLRAERHRRPLGVLMIDVDFFKRVNDAMGHPAGDELLRRLAGVLGMDLRQTDLIARYGGEEFAVLLPETTKLEALQVAERMRASVESRVNEGTAWVQRVTVSIGVATFPEDGRTAEQLLQAADQAMYGAKRTGRNKVMGLKGAA